MGHAALAAWAGQVAPAARIGVEGSSSFGAPLACFLLERGFAVREVPPQFSRRERPRTRRAGKSDPGDALAIARVTAREAELPPVRVADRSSDIKLLVEARDDVAAEMVRVRNRLHADLRILVPGYGAKIANLVAAHTQSGSATESTLSAIWRCPRWYRSPEVGSGANRWKDSTASRAATDVMDVPQTDEAGYLCAARCSPSSPRPLPQDTEIVGLRHARPLLGRSIRHLDEFYTSPKRPPVESFPLVPVQIGAQDPIGVARRWD